MADEHSIVLSRPEPLVVRCLRDLAVCFPVALTPYYPLQAGHIHIPRVDAP